MQKSIPQVKYTYLKIYSLFSALLLLLYIPAYSFLQSRNEENLLLRWNRQVEYGAYSLSSTISVLNNIIELTTNDSSFQILNYTDIDSYTRSYTASKLPFFLQKMIAASDSIVDIGIINKADYIVTNKHYYTSEQSWMFYDSDLSVDGMTRDEWMYAVKTNKRGFLPAMDYSSNMRTSRYNAITYISPWSRNGTPSNTIFFATIDTDALIKNILDPQLLGSNCYVEVSNIGFSPFFTYGTKTGEVYSRLDSNRYGGIVVSVFIPVSELSSWLKPYQQNYLALGSIVLVIALVLVIIFTRHSARPLCDFYSKASQHKYMQLVGERHSNTPKGISQGLGDILDGISSMSVQIDNYTQKLEESHEIIRDQLLEKAVMTGLDTASERDAFHKIYPAFPECYRIILFRHTGFANINELSLLSLLLESIDCATYQHLLRLETSLIIVPSQDDTKALKEQLSFIMSKVYDKLGLTLSVVLSNSYSGVDQLVQAYQSVQYIYGSIGSIYEPATESYNAHRILPITMGNLQSIYNALQASNYAVIEKILKESTAALFADAENAFYCRHCYDLLAEIIVQIKMEYPALLNPVILPQYDYINRRTVFEECFPACFLQICDIIRMSRNSDADDISDDILRFIEENLPNPELYVDMILDKFSISSATLQRIIKAATGQTCSNYIETRRLDLAYELLSNGFESIEKVSRLCGFSSRNTFYKAFRRKFEIPPSQIKHQNNREAE